MVEGKNTIIGSWPALKEDLLDFLTDTDAWVISSLKEAYKAKDWTKIRKIIDIMDTVHDISHAH